MMLELAIREGLALVEADMSHDLELQHRRRIMLLLDGESGDRAKGHRRRVRLDVMAVAKVLPLWDAVLPEDDTPRAALKLIQMFDEGKLDESRARAEAGRLWTDCDNLIYKHEGLVNQVVVGYAAIGALHRRVKDSYGDSANALRDIDVDPYEHNSDFLAAVAYAKGAVWEADSDREKRREFWVWWLSDAVRAAAELN